MIWLQSLLPGLSSLVPVLNTPNTMVGMPRPEGASVKTQNKDTSNRDPRRYASVISTSPCVGGSPSISTSNCSAADLIVAIFCLRIFIDSGRSFSGA